MGDGQLLHFDPGGLKLGQDSPDDAPIAGDHRALGAIDRGDRHLFEIRLERFENTALTRLNRSHRAISEQALHEPRTSRNELQTIFKAVDSGDAGSDQLAHAVTHDSHGLDTFRKVYEKIENLPVIVLTGKQNNDDAIAAMRAGVQDYLPKEDLDAKVIVRSIRYAVERSRLTCAMTQQVKINKDEAECAY